MSNWTSFLLLLGAILCHGAGSHDVDVHAEGEYLLLLKNTGGLPVRNVEMSVDKTLHVGEFGGRSYLHVKASDEQFKLLQENDMVETIEPNHQISRSKPVDSGLLNATPNSTPKLGSYESSVCVEQSPNPDSWGPTRTSYRNKPDFTADGYQYDFAGSGVDIYILDSGIDINHEEFASDVSIRATHSYTAPELEEEGEIDYDGRGTLLASLAGGKQFGTAKDANLFSVKVLNENGTGSYASIISGIEHVRDKVRSESKTTRAVIVMSLATGRFSQPMYDVIQDAINEGVIVVVPAGDHQTDASYLYPAAFDNTITVGASDKDDFMAFFSNFGTTIDLLAPGHQVIGAGSTYSYICVNDTEGECYISASGSEMAAAYVAGIVARYMESLSDSQMAVTGQETFRKLLLGWSTKDQISYYSVWEQGTPNRLLYKACGTPTPTPSVASSANANQQITVYLVMFLMFISSLRSLKMRYQY